MAKTKWDKEHKMISITNESHERLRVMGNIGDSFDDAIVILLDFWDKHKDLRE